MKESSSSSTKLTLMERTAHTFENYVSSDLHSYYYSEKFLDGFANQRNEIHQKAGRNFFGLLLLTVSLAFFDALSGDVTILGVTVNVSDKLTAAISVFVGMALFANVTTFLDLLIMERYMGILGAKAGLYSFGLVLLDRSALNLWTEPTVPKYFGLRSRNGHKAAQGVLGVFMAMVLVVMIAFPIIVSISTFLNIIYEPDSNIYQYLLSGVGLIFCLMSVILVLIFWFNYSFDEAHLEEVGGAATPEFLDSLKAQGVGVSSESERNKTEPE